MYNRTKKNENDMKEKNSEGHRPVNFFGIGKSLLPSLPWFPRTEAIVTEVADKIAEQHFVVRYDRQTAPLIDAAVMRNPCLDADAHRDMLDQLLTDDHIILYDSGEQPPLMGALADDEGDYADFITYEDCVDYAEGALNVLLRFSDFDYRSYVLYAGAAFAIVRSMHPDWQYETFIECFRRDVADRMAWRSDDYLGYREFAVSREVA